MLLRLLSPVIIARLLLRSRREPAYRRHIAERFGLYRGAVAPGEAPLLWLHAVSLGETRAARPLLDELRRRRPGLRLLLTHMTATGREAGAELLRPGDIQVWLPYDMPGAVGRFLARFRPAAGVLMETEVWPNLAAACARRGIPLMLANARMSARSAARWARWPELGGPAFASLAVAAQTEADRDRLAALGARDAIVAGNLKFDLRPDPRLIELGARWRAAAGRPVLLLASTREHRGVAEEALLLDAMPPGLLERALVVLVPRHPQRMDAVHALLRARGIDVVRRSAAAPGGAVWLGDSMGEMAAYYAMADCAFVGASLLPLGAQNLIEACAVSCPVVLGPHDFNFADAARQGEEAGAVSRAADAAGVWAAMLAWLDQPEALARARAAAAGFAAAHRGAAAAQADWVLRHLPGPTLEG